MVPLLIGAAAVAAGAALMSDDKPEQEAVTRNKQNISEQRVKQRLNRAGRSIKTIEQGIPNSQTSSEMRFFCSGDFGTDFEKIENMLNSSNVDNDFINNALDAIEERAYQFGDDKVLNFVEYYRHKLSLRSVSYSQSNDFNTEFSKIDEMIEENRNTHIIPGKLHVLEMRARQQRNADAMRKIADYYQRFSNYQKAFSCREDAEYF